MTYVVSTIRMACFKPFGAIYYPRYPEGNPPLTGLGTANATDTTSATAALTGHPTLAAAASDTTSGVANLVSFGFTSTSPLPSATQNAAYSYQFGGQGGVTPYTFTSGGTLPSGANLTTGGLFTWAPANTGTFSFPVTLTDAASDTVTKSFSLTVNSAANLTMYSNGVISNTTWPNVGGGNNYSYPPGSCNYTSTAQTEGGHTYSLAMTPSGSPPACGWQQATDWQDYPPNGLDISGYTWLQFDIYSPYAASVYSMLGHYTRSTGDDIGISTGIPNMANVTSFTINGWTTGVKVPLSSLGMLTSYNYYKFLLQEYGDSGAFYLDNVIFLAGQVAWVYQGTGGLVSGWADGSSGVTVNYSVNPQGIDPALYAINNPSTPASEFTGSISGTTMTVSGLTTGPILVGQTVVGNGGVSGGTTVVSGSGNTWTVTPSQNVGSSAMSTAFGQAHVNIMSLSFTNVNGVWRANYSGGFSIAPYTYFTFGAIPTKTPYAYLVRIYNTQGAQIGNSVNPASYTLNDFGQQTQNFTVYNIPLSAFGLGSTQTIGGVSIEDNTSNSTNLVYLSAVGFFA